MTRFTRIIIGPSSLAIALGCSSASKQSTFTRTEPFLRDRWISSYRLARAGDPGACATFRALALEKNFPAGPLAALRALQVCHEPGATLDRTTLPTYLRELGLDVALYLAGERGDKRTEMESAVEIARRRLPQLEKINWLTVAGARASELGDEKRRAEIQTQLFAVAPRLDPNPAPARWLAVAADFRQARDFARARAYYEKVLAGPKFTLEDKITALKGLRFAAKNARQNDQHLAVARRMNQFLARQRAARSKSPRVRSAVYDARVYEARAVWTEGRHEEADRLLAKIELDQRGRQSLAEIYWLRARLAEEKKDLAEVARYLDLAIAEKPRDQMRDKILWNAAWNERARGASDAAAARLRDLEGGTTDETQRVRATYWLGQVLAAKRRAEAEEAWARTIQLDPVGYYGLLAQRALGRKLRVRTRPDARRVIAPTMDGTLGDWLTALGETEVLALLVDDAAIAYARTSDQSDDAWVDLLQTYARAGLYLKLFTGLANLAPERRRAVLEAHPELLFPRPWESLVHAAAVRFDFDENLVYSIMRQESAFDPKVRSFADAYGLMQLIPEVGARVAKVNRIPFTRGEDMFDPAVSIPLGTAYLKELSDRYRGKLILLSAAYNANDGAIRSWVKTRFRGDTPSFIEEIPYEETRTYVRLVMRNLIFYRLLANPETPIAFPEELLAVDDGARPNE